MKYILTTFIISVYCSLSWAQMPAYYQSIDFSQPAATVESNLKNLITITHNPLTYSQTYNWIKLTDEDVNNSSNVILMYNGQSISKGMTIGGGNTTQAEVWNREHIYPQSLINSPADADLHHLRACDGVINGNRGNSPFVTGSGSYGTASGGWYPGDEWKGDVARMVMYVYLRYNEPWSDVGSLSLFLQWNVEDPVSDFERQRNNIINGAQGNRNPFIDQPYLATYFWGGTPAEDTWGWPNTVEESALKNINVYPNPITSNSTLQLDNINVELNTAYLSDITGRVVQTWSESYFSTSTASITLNDVESGNYFLTMKSDAAEVTKKIVVE
jgi:endonuclease I